MKSQIPENSNISNYTYLLPDSKIAQFPLTNRDESKLLLFHNGKIEENIFANIADYLRPDSFLIFNNTKVINARILFDIGKSKPIEVFCLEPEWPYKLQDLAIHVVGKCIWRCFIGNAKNWKSEIPLRKNISINGENGFITCHKLEQENNSYFVQFEWELNVGFDKILEALGNLPLPPYIDHQANENDKERYQTLFAEHSGSVAAPTAGLHFSEHVFEQLRNKKINFGHVTLHVGAGTFLPVKCENILQHKMHCENISVDKKLIEMLMINNELVAVGTTSLRTLESLYWIGVRFIKNETNPLFLPQFYALENLECNITKQDALFAIINYMHENKLEKIDASTQIMCLPPYDFKLVKKIITNFHQPQSTLLMLIAAFVGPQWKDIYNYALDNNFRFLSYGDTSLLEYQYD